MWWYNDYDHIGYDTEGNKILKPEQGDSIDNFLDKMENPNYWFVWLFTFNLSIPASFSLLIFLNLEFICQVLYIYIYIYIYLYSYNKYTFFHPFQYNKTINKDKRSKRVIQCIQHLALH